MNSITKSDLINAAVKFSNESPMNHLDKDTAMMPNLVGMRIFEEPLLAVADASDPFFETLKAPESVGPQFMLPEVWLSGARSVISFFLPFTEQVIIANQQESVEVPPEWLHARVEGQAALESLAKYLQNMLVDAGYPSIVPSSDPRFKLNRTPEVVERDGVIWPSFTSNWSERHVAYVCGLGTFGLSKGLITQCGKAGRFGSIVTTLLLEPDARPYSRYDEYCTYCGDCIPRCPVNAIDLGEGKNKKTCWVVQEESRVKYAPRYGCGKCYVDVPCATKIP